ncbi:cytochrome P450 [Exilibacterium tricleocarpae]|uniref:Cytochrome P450 n=1 Tax=Exilibacterium tricleocarpae TaxID=2591008 RepID=A0A545SY27_9GAMM|nr:cytochrome P450 [Exilibacterium tricleocarpae]TQV69864.1 cytochrome P450 [Exilibacterium tricleocarpae]
MSTVAVKYAPENKVDLLSKQNLINPFPDYKLLREHYPVCRVEPNRFWAVSRFEDVRFMLKRHDLFSCSAYSDMFQADWLSEDCKSDRFIATLDPPEHTQRHALVNKAFVGRVINAQIPHMKKAAEDLIPALRAKGEVDFLEYFSYPYVGGFLGRIIGTGDVQGLKDMRRWMQMEELLTLRRPSDEFIAEYEYLLRKHRAQFTKIIEHKRENPENDLVTALIQAEIDGEKLTGRMLRDALEIFVAAGFQTPVQMLCACIIQLSRRPELLAELRQSPELIPAFIEEAMRFAPSLHGALRRTRSDVEIAGVTIPEGEYVIALLAAANRDPAQFPDPDSFQLSRPNVKTHLAFGYGAHICIGEALARLQIKIALETLLENFSHISCPPEDQINWAPAIFVRGLLTLPTRFK